MPTVKTVEPPDLYYEDFTKEVTFSAAELKAPLPKVGEIIDITYTRTTGGLMKSINLNSSRSNVY
jgi:hypothetical protein